MKKRGAKTSGEGAVAGISARNFCIYTASEALYGLKSLFLISVSNLHYLVTIVTKKDVSILYISNLRHVTSWKALIVLLHFVTWLLQLFRAPVKNLLHLLHRNLLITNKLPLVTNVTRSSSFSIGVAQFSVFSRKNRRKASSFYLNFPS